MSMINTINWWDRVDCLVKSAFLKIDTQSGNLDASMFLHYHSNSVRHTLTTDLLCKCIDNINNSNSATAPKKESEQILKKHKDL